MKEAALHFHLVQDSGTVDNRTVLLQWAKEAPWLLKMDRLNFCISAATLLVCFRPLLLLELLKSVNPLC
jgi:hypothetical protein